MSSPKLARLREADIPWILHVATLTISPYFLPPPSVYTFVILYILASFLLDAETLLAALQHPDEPPMIPHPYLPFLGHVLGMFLHGASYFARVNASTNYPIYTILTLTGRTVIVTDPYLAGTIQKASKNTSFYGMILEVTKRLVDLDDTSMDVICWNINGEHGAREGLMLESSKAVTCIQSHAGAPKEKKINVTRLKGECPLLVSVYRETLRTIANLSSVRLVTNTHAVTAPGHRTYSLRKGSMVQIASGVIHMEEAIWGPDARNFNPARFISTTTNEQSLSLDVEHGAGPLPKVPSAAYRGFGGGSVICPGRHFAQNEILGFVALCIHSLDIVDAETRDVFALPLRDDERIPLSVMKPVKEPRVLIKRKEGEESVMWKLEL